MLLTTKEIALKWGVSVTWVTVLCKKGRIEGAIREGNRWYIPEDAKKPEDKRSCKNAPAKARFRFIDLFAGDRKSTRLNSSHDRQSRMPSSA